MAGVEVMAMQDTRLRLYADARFTSPWAMSAFVALHEKGLLFETLPVDLQADANHEPVFAAMSMTERVPVLVHDVFAVSESSAITEYLEEMFVGVPLYPADLRLRARARQIQAWLRSDLAPIKAERSMETVFCERATSPLSDTAMACAHTLFAACEQLLGPGRRNLFEDTWCIADTDLAVMLNRLVLNGDPVPARLVEYARYQWLRPSVQKWVKLERG